MPVVTSVFRDSEEGCGKELGSLKERHSVFFLGIQDATAGKIT